MLKTTDVLNIAKKHSIKREVASPNFFEGALLGILDIEKLKRHIRYCMLPNETLADRVTLCGGRYASARVTSETGGVFRLENPRRAARDRSGRVYTDAEIRIEMAVGETVELSPAE